MPATREAKAIWRGDLKGSGEVTAVSSGRFDALPVSWAARTETADGKTSPEELLAAAHASCFAMAFSAGLGKKGTPADRLDITAKVTFDKLADIWTVISSELEVTGIVPGSDAETFAQEAERAGNDCPISRALRGVKVSVKAQLAERSEARA